MNRRLRYALIAIFALSGVLLYLLATASANTGRFAQNYSLLVKLNAGIVVVMLLVIGYLLFGLWRRYRAKQFGGWPRDGFSHAEIVMIFDITKIQRPEQFLQTNNLRPVPSSLSNAGNGFLNVGFHIGGAGHLNKANVNFS